MNAFLKLVLGVRIIASLVQVATCYLNKLLREFALIAESATEMLYSGVGSSLFIWREYGIDETDTRESGRPVRKLKRCEEDCDVVGVGC